MHSTNIHKTVGSGQKNCVAWLIAGNRDYNAKNNPHPFCTDFAANIELYLTLSLEKYQAIHDTVKNIQALLPRPLPTKTHKRIKERMVLLPFVGQLSRSLFGTASLDDVQGLANTLNAVVQIVNRQRDVFKRTDDHFASYIQIANEHFKTLESKLANITMEQTQYLEQWGNQSTLR